MKHVLENGFKGHQNGTPTNAETAKVFHKDWMGGFLEKPVLRSEIEDFLKDSKARCESFLSFVDQRRKEILEAC